MQQGSPLRRAVDLAEEGLLAFLFAAMTLITFSQVVARYVFNSGAVWALELTTYCFAWLVLLGVPYGVKIAAHLGVDAFVKLFPDRAQRVLGLITVAAGLLYAGIMLQGSWNYVSKLYKIGISSEDLPIPQWVPMAVLILAMALLLFRLLEAGWRIVKGETKSLLPDEARVTIKEITGAEPPMAGKDRG